MAFNWQTRDYRSTHFWTTVPHVRLDDSGALVEVDNLCPTEEALLQLTDVERVLELFGDDVLLHAAAAGTGAGRGVPAADGKKDADAPDAGAMGARKNWKMDDPALCSYALATTQRIIQLAADFAHSHGKQILFVLSYSSPTVARAIETGATS